MMSTVTFYNDLGFDRDHRNVRDFATVTDRDAWFATKASGYSPGEINYDKVQNELKVEMDYATALTFSYCRIDYPAQGGSQTVFCFIDSVELRNDRTCAFTLTVDVWQTYLFNADGTQRFTLDRSFVVRSHMDRWGSGATPTMQIYPKEGIDGFAKVASTERLGQTIGLTTGQYWYWVVMAQTYSVNDTTKGVRYLSFPCVFSEANTSISVTFQNYAVPTLASVMDGSLFVKWNMDPESFSSIAVMPFWGIRVFAVTKSSDGVYQITSVTSSWNMSYIRDASDDEVMFTVTGITFPSMSGYVDSVAVDVPTKPGTSATLTESEDFEPTMFMSPVRSYTMYGADGSPLMVLSDDVVLSSQGTVRMEAISTPGASGSNVRLLFGDDATTFGEYDALNRACEIPDMKMDVASNSWMSYVVTERNTTRELQNIQNQRTAASVATSVASSVFGGFLFGATTQAVEGAFDIINAERILQTNEQGIRNRTAGLLSAGGAGVMFNTAPMPVLVQTVADDTTRAMFYEKVRREGYAVNRYMTPNIRSRRVFNHIVTMGAVVRGDMMESVRSAIAEIFDKGVTIWHDDYDYDSDIANIERSLYE